MSSVVAFHVFGGSVFGNPPSTPLVIRDSTGGVLVSSSVGNVLTFLRYRHSGVLRVVWDLDDFVAPILRLLPVSVLESLARFDENTQYDGHQLYYLGDRIFRVGKSRFYGIRSFWPSTEPIPELVGVQAKVEELLTTLALCGFPEPRKLTSPIAVFEDSEQGRAFYASVPKGYDIPLDCSEVLDYAYKCDRREWVTAYQLGHWGAGEVFDYDCISCYSSVARDLPDIRGAKVWKSTTIDWDADFGFLRGHMWIDPILSHLSPIIATVGDLPGNPTGDLGDDYFCTLDEARFVVESHVGKFIMTDGWFIRCDGSKLASLPFRALLDRFYKQRELSPLASSIMKGIANQLIGKLIETRVSGDYGAIRNDIYHATILAKARVNLAKKLMTDNIRPDELIVVQTDGFRVNRLLPSGGNGMGSWRMVGSQPTIVASPYRVYTGERRPNSITYDDLVTAVNKHPLSSNYGLSVPHRLTMRQALDMGDVASVGRTVPTPTRLDLNTIPREQNRLFGKFPRTGMALLGNRYKSEPVVL